jgi:hypothetical protein
VLVETKALMTFALLSSFYGDLGNNPPMVPQTLTKESIIQNPTKFSRFFGTPNKNRIKTLDK